MHDRHSEDRHHLVADELFDRAAVLLDDVAHPLEETHLHASVCLRVPFREPGRVDEIAKEDRDDLPHFSCGRAHTRECRTSSFRTTGRCCRLTSPLDWSSVLEVMEQTTTTIREFLVDLADDPARLVAYRKDSEQALASSQLTHDQRDLLRTDDLVGLRLAMRKETGDDDGHGGAGNYVQPPPPDDEDDEDEDENE